MVDLNHAPNLPEMRAIFYNHLQLRDNGRNQPNWRGVRVVKYANDLILYQQAIYENRPDWIIETGTKRGGSALFFADMLTLFGGKGKVISVDIAPMATPEHPKVEYILGNSIDRKIVDDIRGRISGKVMVVLDSDHRRHHVKWELHHYSKMVTPGQFLVVEDCYTRSEELYGPGQAVEWFLPRTKRFKREAREDQFILAITRGGWLRRV